MNISVQLYTLRKSITSDLEGHLIKLKQMGYDYLEFAGFYDLHPQVVKKMLAEVGIKASSSHTSLKDLEEKYDEMIDYFKTIDIKNIVIPNAHIHDESSYKAALPRINNVTKKLIKDGFFVHYHNHGQEFESFDGQYIIEHLLNDIKEIDLQFDVYWAKVAGVDIHAFSNKYQHRIKLLHAKDLQTDEHGQPYFESVGKGQFDFKKIISDLPKLTYVIVENDKPKNDALQNVKDSIEYLNQLLKEI
jgi:sugar phosphate isomerase/epimerase